MRRKTHSAGGLMRSDDKNPSRLALDRLLAGDPCVGTWETNLLARAGHPVARAQVRPASDVMHTEVLPRRQPATSAALSPRIDIVRGGKTVAPRTDRALALRALELSKRCVSEPGRTSPKVGAVLTRDGKFIGGAYRGELRAGEHAEYTLLVRKLDGVDLRGTTLYTTLEPCTCRNHPKIPCVEHILARGIERVVIGMVDPDGRIRGNGELSLQDAGVDVARFDADLMRAVRQLNRDFYELHRPCSKLLYDA